jgi:hypothetical protein
VTEPYEFEGDFPTPQTVDEMRAAWTLIEATWTATIDRARRLPAEAVYERVAGEWSFVETLRHLVFATDSWIRRPILHLPSAFWSGDLPHSSYGDRAAALGIDVGTRPDLDAVLAIRADRGSEIRTLLAGLTATDLDRVVAPNPIDVPDDEQLTVHDCFGTVFEEEWLHHGYATRDLAVLEAGGG